MDQQHSITLKDACHVWLNLPEWIRFYEDMKDPLFLGTLSVDGDENVRMQMYEALGLHRLGVAINVKETEKQQAWLLFDTAVRAYLSDPA